MLAERDFNPRCLPTWVPDLQSGAIVRSAISQFKKRKVRESNPRAMTTSRFQDGFLGPTGHFPIKNKELSRSSRIRTRGPLSERSPI